MHYYDKEQRANNIALLYLLLQEFHPSKEITLSDIATNYDQLLDEIMHLLPEN